MKTHPYRIRRAQVVMGVCLGLGIVDLAACSSSESAQGGKHVEYGHWAGVVDAGDIGDASRIDGSVMRWPHIVQPGEIPYTPLVDGGTGVRSDIDTVGNRGIVPELLSITIERTYGVTLSPLDKERVNTCPRRAWSKNVPDRDCTKDNECGDGICDRGHCSAIYTCVRYPGGPCKTDAHCDGFCMEGRCRSCVSDAECQKKTMNPFEICGPPRRNSPGRGCTSWRSVRPDEEPALKAHCDAAPADKKPPYCPHP